MDTTRQMDAFLDRYGLLPDAIDLETTTSAFLAAMKAGLAGRPSSLMMLPTWLSGQTEAPKTGRAIAIDAGGTNLRVAVVAFDAAGPHILAQTRHRMPGTGAAITKEDFFQTLAAYITPFRDMANRVGFCFSFPAVILEDLDARVIRFNKEIRVTGSEGMLLCRELRPFLPEAKRMVVVNDTAATLLGGAGLPGRHDGLVGFILGTGTNTCYPERRENLPGCPGGAGFMLVNTESAGFNGFPLGELDRRFDAQCEIPGDHLYEKLVSGGYQGGLIRLTLQEAAREGLLPEAFRALPGLDMAQVDAFTRSPDTPGALSGLCKDDSSRKRVYHICLRAIQRSARLVTANLAAVLQQGDFGKSAPARIIAEGSTFWRSRLYQQTIRQTMDAYVSSLGRRYEFAAAPDANLIGAAAAALGN